MNYKILLTLIIAAASQAQAKTINVADFGALPDGKDDTRAVKAALQACKEQGATKLVFPEGRYDFYPTFADEMYFFISNNDEGLKRVAFPMIGMENLTLDGQGSEFIFHGFINPFIVDRSENIIFKDFWSHD